MSGGVGGGLDPHLFSVLYTAAVLAALALLFRWGERRLNKFNSNVLQGFNCSSVHRDKKLNSYKTIH